MSISELVLRFYLPACWAEGLSQQRHLYTCILQERNQKSGAISDNVVQNIIYIFKTSSYQLLFLLPLFCKWPLVWSRCCALLGHGGDIEMWHQSCSRNFSGAMMLEWHKGTWRGQVTESTLKMLLKCSLCWSGLKASFEGSEFLALCPQRTLSFYRRLFVLYSFSAADTWLRHKKAS